MDKPRSHSLGFEALLVLCLLGAPTLFPVAAVAAPGDLDASFGVGGVVREASGVFWRKALALQSDGRILFCRTTDTDLIVRRVLSDGSDDPGFGVGGEVVVDTGAPEVCTALVVQPDGRILVVGTTTSDTPAQVLVVRLLGDGSLDPGWNGTGIATLASEVGVAGDANNGPDVAIQNDGRVVVSGTREADVLVARFLSNGLPDPGFALGGVGLFDVAGEGDRAQALALQADGKILVAADTGAGTPGVLRLDSGGDPDPSFGTLGFAAVASPGGLISDVDVQGDGRIVLIGSTAAGVGSAFLARFATDGSLDPSFGSGGVVGGVLGPVVSNGRGIAVQPDGKILAAGITIALFPSAVVDARVSRLLSNGAIDATWGSGGFADHDLGQLDVAWELRFQGDGGLLVSGFGVVPSPDEIVIMRLENDFAPPPDCGDGDLDAGEDCDDGNNAAGDCCSSSCAYESAGTLCGAAFACSAFQCDGAGGCAAEPLVDGLPCDAPEACNMGACYSGSCQGGIAGGFACKQQTISRGSFKIRNDADAAKDQLGWRWVAGEVTTAAEFQQQEYRLCVYDSSASPQPVLRIQTNGDTCGAFDCWRPRGNQAVYLDAAGTHDGLRQIFPKAGADGKARLGVLAGGGNLGPPALPLTPPVTVQMHSQSGDCWESTYSAPKKNDTGLFKSKPD